MKLTKILEQIEGWFFPRTGGTALRDGMGDPVGNAELMTAYRRGSMNKDIDGNLYYPTSGGYHRTKTTVQRPSSQPLQFATNDDVAVPLASFPTYAYYKAMACYQNSGAPITLNFGNSGKTITLYSISVNNATLTLLPDIANIDLPIYTYVWWSVAGGVSQYVNVIGYVDLQIDQDGA